MSDCIIVYDLIEDWGRSETRPSFTGKPFAKIDRHRTTPCCDRFKHFLHEDDGRADPEVWVYWQDLPGHWTVVIGSMTGVTYCPWCATHIRLEVGGVFRRVIRRVPADPVPMMEKEFIEPTGPAEAKKDG